MVQFRRFERAIGGGEVYVNVEQVTYVNRNRGDGGGTLIHFGSESGGVIVVGDPGDIMKVFGATA